MGVAVVVALVAVVAIYIHAPIKKTNAQSGVPTASITWDSNAGWHISLSSDGPFTQDIQAKICVTSNNSSVSGVSGGTSYPYVYCATTPWASQTTASSPGWSPWIWPGYDNGLYVGPSTIPEHVSVINGVPQYGVVSVTLNTQPLPIAGETLSNVSLGLDVAETNGGPSNYNTPYVACEYGFTPAGGGISPAIHGYVYQNCSSLSTWVDSVQAGISATLNALPNAQLSSDNIATFSDVNETKYIGTDTNSLNIVMQNTGATTWASDLHTVVGTPTGTCTYDSNGDGVNDAPIPNAANKGASCTTSYDYSSSQIKLQHTASSFSLTPEAVSYSNIVKITNTVVYAPSEKYCAEYSGGGGYNSALKTIPQWLIKTALAVSLNGNSHCIDWEYTDPYYYISSSESGSLDILPGSTTTFNISSIKAPSTPGTYNETWQMEQNGNPFGSSAVVPITVGNGGTITVTSEDAMNTSTLVNASWDLTGPVKNSVDGIVCSATGNVMNKAGFPINVLWNGGSCSGTNQTYSGVPADDTGSNYTLPDATTTVPGYTLRSIERVPVAEKKDNSLLGSLQLSLKNMFSTVAFAQKIYSSINGVLSYSGSQTLYPSYPSAAFVILWTPAPTSTAGYDCESNNQCVSTTTNPQYSSLSSCNTACGGGVPKYYICTNPVAGTCATTSTPGYGSCAAACAGNPRSVSASCLPASITTAQTSQCSVYLNGTAQNNVSWALSSGTAGGSIGASSGVYAPSAVGTETVGGTLPDGTLAQATVTVTPIVPQLPACTPGDPTCQATCSPSLTASPTSIVVPESSKLSYSCSNVTECQLTGGDLTGSSPTPLPPLSSPGTIIGNTTTSPSITTTYTLTCVNGKYGSSDSTSSTVQVTVNGSSYCEQNPNGVGCQ